MAGREDPRRAGSPPRSTALHPTMAVGRIEAQECLLLVEEEEEEEVLDLLEEVLALEGRARGECRCNASRPAN